LTDFDRPLPEEMFFYAMTDTHFLLYIFDNLRNELVERSNTANPEENRIELVLQKSKATSLLRFERQIYEENSGQGPAGWYNLLVKTLALFSNEQFAVFRAIHAWRDQIARKDDDSTHYVMPNHVIFTLAKLMPMDMVSLYGAIHPISHNVKSRTAELLALIRSAKEAGKDGPSMMDVLRPESVGTAVKATSPLAAPGHKGGERSLAPKPSAVSVNKDQLRTNKSMFWGGAFGSSIWDPSSVSARNSMDFRLAVPMPQVASELSTDLIDGSADLYRSRDKYQAPQEGQSMPASQDNHDLEEEAFTIKSGRKRKAKAMEIEWTALDESSKEYDIPLNDEEEEKAREKAARKAERKAQKKLEKAARKLARGDGTKAIAFDGQEEEVFDYRNAESVLHRKRNDVADGLKAEKPFDPYAKSSNVPKGMRKLQTERAGKSFTFKS
jgi:exosome complex exonuclease RRP6